MWIFRLARAASLEEHRSDFYRPVEVEEPVQAGSVADFGAGSGFVLADGSSILTCLHVAREVRERGVVTLGRGTAGSRTVRVTIVATAPELDLALYRTETPVGAGFAVRNEPPVVGEPVLVVGHPDGEPVRVSYGRVLRTGIRITSVPAIEYDARTGWGSSGSVVLDGEGRAIAVHWAYDFAGRWDGWMMGIPLVEAASRWPPLAEALAP